MNLVLLNNGQVTRKTPQLLPLSLLTSTPQEREDKHLPVIVDIFNVPRRAILDIFNVHQPFLHDLSSAVSVSNS
ncbi:hypothetical protein TNCV_5041931 [Trichonephila clavipes]|nr:hypothetical protein TNCV_5041931 [Trichonephila clavipes]